MRRLFRQFSTPGGIPSHVSVPTPGSIHEGGELGYVLTHAFGAAFDNPDLIVAAVVGDGEAETGPLDGLLEEHQLPQPGPRRRGAADPAPERLQDRQPDRARPRRATTTCGRCSKATATRSTSSRVTIPRACTRRSPRRSDACYARDSRHPAGRPSATRTGVTRIAPALAGDRPAHAERAGPGRRWSTACRSRAPSARTRCRSPNVQDQPRATARCSRRGCAATSPRNCSTRTAGSIPELAALAPTGDRRMGANPHANGGKLLVDLDLPDFRDYALEVDAARHRAPRIHAPARQDAARHLHAATRRRPTSACSARTRRTPTGWATSSRSRTAASSARSFRSTTTSPRTAG